MDRLAEEAVRHPDLRLDPLNEKGLDARDAALAHALYDASVRRWITIAALAGRFLRQPWPGLEPPVRAALLAGAAQCLFFDRVPVHAAIDESVEWTKALRGKGASGLVNAVLRRLAELPERDPDGAPALDPAWENAPDRLPMPDGRAARLPANTLPADPVARAAVACGLPRWQVDRWADAFGVEKTVAICRHTLATGPTILHAPGRSPADHPGLLAHEAPGHLVFSGTRPELQSLLAAWPDAWVQDPTAADALRLAPEGTGRVIDLCAGRGTKTRQLLATRPGALITACEVSPARLEDLQRLAEGHAARLTVCRPAEAAAELAGAADLVLADVPCSNSGVLARRVEARHRCGPTQLVRLRDQQREILTLARGMVAPSGVVLYATCSLEAEENREIAAWAERALGLTLEDHRLTLPAGGPGLPTTTYRDGGFAARLRAP
jgi:16S rRNA (cytosine967-C5)-methyltransferase